MGKFIAGMQISVDGYIEGTEGYADWVDAWSDTFDLERQVEACLLGGKMYPGYEHYWGTIQANPSEPLAMSGQVPTQGEVEYAAFATQTPHFVLTKNLTEPQWTNTRLLSDINEVQYLKQRYVKDIYVVGGAMMISSLINLGWLDELRLTVHPLLVGVGKQLFENVEQRHQLKLARVEAMNQGRVSLVYSFNP